MAGLTFLWRLGLVLKFGCRIKSGTDLFVHRFRALCIYDVIVVGMTSSESRSPGEEPENLSCRNARVLQYRYRTVGLAFALPLPLPFVTRTVDHSSLSIFVFSIQIGSRNPWKSIEFQRNLFKQSLLVPVQGQIDLRLQQLQWRPVRLCQL